MVQKELKHVKYPYNSLPEAPHPIDILYLHNHLGASVGDPNSSSAAGRDTQWEAQETSKRQNDSSISLPANIPPLPSAIQGFSALTEEGEFDPPPKKPVKQQKVIMYHANAFQPTIEPAGIPTGLDGPMKNQVDCVLYRRVMMSLHPQQAAWLHPLTTHWCEISQEYWWCWVLVKKKVCVSSSTTMNNVKGNGKEHHQLNLKIIDDILDSLWSTLLQTIQHLLKCTVLNLHLNAFTS